MKLTKKQVEQDFKENILPHIKGIEAENGNGKDSIMRSEEWANYTDSLCKDGQISSANYENWSTPKICN